MWYISGFVDLCLHELLKWSGKLVNDRTLIFTAPSGDETKSKVPVYVGGGLLSTSKVTHY